MMTEAQKKLFSGFVANLEENELHKLKATVKKGDEASKLLGQDEKSKQKPSN